MQIVVVGFGWVGQANALSLAKRGYPVAFYDPKEPTRHYEKEHASVYAQVRRLTRVTEIDSANTCYIVSVGDRVADDGTQDISLIAGALDSLKGVKGTVVLRSTVLPHLLKDLSFDFYVPEFLHEKYAVDECGTPHFLVIGKNSDRTEPYFLADWEKSAYKTFRGTPVEASHIKYLSNLWNSVRIAFANEYGDSIRTPDTREDVAAIERVIDFVFDGKFYLRYGRSFGGHCLPKDTRAYIWGQMQRGREMPLLSGAYAANTAHQKLEASGVLTEWFSAWQKPSLSGRVAIKAAISAVRRRLVGARS
jgi:UDP-glucose 6-dehydrogenase